MTEGKFSEMEKVCNDWSAREFYHAVRYASFKSEATKRYSELMAAKNK